MIIRRILSIAGALALAGLVAALNLPADFFGGEDVAAVPRAPSGDEPYSLTVLDQPSPVRWLVQDVLPPCPPPAAFAPGNDETPSPRPRPPDAPRGKYRTEILQPFRLPFIRTEKTRLQEDDDQ